MATIYPLKDTSVTEHKPRLSGGRCLYGVQAYGAQGASIRLGGRNRVNWEQSRGADRRTVLGWYVRCGWWVCRVMIVGRRRGK